MRRTSEQTNKQKIEWKNEQTNERMNEQTNKITIERTNGRTDERTSERTNEWTSEQTSKRTNEQMYDDRTSEQANGRANERTNRWTDEQSKAMNCTGHTRAIISLDGGVRQQSITECRTYVIVLSSKTLHCEWQSGLRINCARSEQITSFVEIDKKCRVPNSIYA